MAQRRSSERTFADLEAIRCAPLGLRLPAGTVLAAATSSYAMVLPVPYLSPPFLLCILLVRPASTLS